MGPGPKDENAYRLYFGESYQHSRWNKAVIENMLVLVAERKNNYNLQGELSTDAIRATIRDFIKQAQFSWNSLNVHLTDEGRVETQDEARARVANYLERRGNDARINTRKHQVAY